MKNYIFFLFIINSNIFGALNIIPLSKIYPATSKANANGLELAVQYDMLGEFKVLLDKQYKLNNNYIISQKLIISACMTETLNIFNFLCSTEKIDNCSLESILRIAISKNNTNIIQVLIDNKINLEEFLKNNPMVFYSACYQRKTQIILCIINAYPKLLKKDINGLFILSRFRDLQDVIYILSELINFPHVKIKQKYFAEHAKQKDLLFKLLQRNISVDDDKLFKELVILEPGINEMDCLEYFNAIKRYISFILRQATYAHTEERNKYIENIKKLKDLNLLYSPSQIAELVAKTINAPIYDKLVVNEFIKRVAIYFDLYELQKSNPKLAASYIKYLSLL